MPQGPGILIKRSTIIYCGPFCIHRLAQRSRYLTKHPKKGFKKSQNRLLHRRGSRGGGARAPLDLSKNWLTKCYKYRPQITVLGGTCPPRPITKLADQILQIDPNSLCPPPLPVCVPPLDYPFWIRPLLRQ